MTFLWTGGGKGAPPDYTDLILCRDVYHCTPSQLDAEDGSRVLMHLALLNAESKVKEARSKANAAHARAARAKRKKR